VIFLTAKTEADDEKQGFEVGAVDYIHKPFSAPIVLARVNTHLALQAALQQRTKLKSKRMNYSTACYLMPRPRRFATLAR
jgi:DNA-binding response OmpR family regulator